MLLIINIVMVKYILLRMFHVKRKTDRNNILNMQTYT